MTLRVMPLTLGQANGMVMLLHRHHKPAQGHRFSLGAIKDGKMVGAIIVGRPVGRMNPQYDWCEVTRLCTDGTYNACSFLYGAAARVAKEMGFKRIQTFILDSENGSSLKASGWVFDCYSDGGDWNSSSFKNRRTDQPQGKKQRWKKEFN